MKTKSSKYIVSVRCFTYNQALYIEDTLRGFTMQETTFPFVCIIIDDTSTDGEQEAIIRYLTQNFKEPYRIENLEYAEVIRAEHKTNPNCQFVVMLLKYNHHQIHKAKMPYLAEWLENSKYHAMCEGDDYWIDPLKLQKQVDFMESHPDYGMCYGRKRNIVKGKLEDNPVPNLDSPKLPSLIYHNNIATLTVLMKGELYFRYLDEICPSDKGWKMGDYPIWLWMEFNSKVGFIDEVFGVYRISDESASHSQDYRKRLAFIESARDIRLFFAEKYGLDSDVITKINNVFYREKSMLVKGMDKRAYKDALKHISDKTFKERVKYILSVFSL